MTQVPEACKQAKKHILFHNYCITTKICPRMTRQYAMWKWVVWGYVVGGTLVSGTTQKCTINTKKYCTIHNTDTVAYATHNGSYSTECKKEVHWYTHGTQQLQQYATFTVVHNTYMAQKHLGYLSVKLLQP